MADIGVWLYCIMEYSIYYKKGLLQPQWIFAKPVTPAV